MIVVYSDELRRQHLQHQLTHTAITAAAAAAAADDDDDDDARLSSTL